MTREIRSFVAWLVGIATVHALVVVPSIMYYCGELIEKRTAARLTPIEQRLTRIENLLLEELLRDRPEIR